MSTYRTLAPLYIGTVYIEAGTTITVANGSWIPPAMVDPIDSGFLECRCADRRLDQTAMVDAARQSAGRLLAAGQSGAWCVWSVAAHWRRRRVGTAGDEQSRRAAVIGANKVQQKAQMATNRSGYRPGGGLHSRQVVHRPHGKTEPVANKYRPHGVSQYGQMQGSHITRGGESDYRGEAKRGGRGYEPPGMITNPLNTDRPGGGRTIYSTGSQSTHGSTNPGKPGLPSTKGQWPD
jgi:hypothetical protein